MSPATASPKVKPVHVGIGGLESATAPDRIATLLGSCIAIVVYDSSLKMASLAHIVLPDSKGDSSMPGKYADTAVPALVQALAKKGGLRGRMVAKIAGGAAMFNAAGPMQIGDQNITAVRDELKEAGIKIIAEDVGGEKGRRVEFDCETGDLKVLQAGKPPFSI